MRAPCRAWCAAWALVSAALVGCAPEDRLAALDLAGSTMSVQPANVVAGASGGARVTVATHAGDGTVVADARLRIALQADGCSVSPATAVALGADGRAVFDLHGCTPGAHTLAARATMGGVDLRLAATSSLNAYQPAASDADALAVGSPLSLAVDAGYGFVGEVQFVSSDPLATLPGALQLDGARHGVAVLARQVVLRTPGVQTVSVVDAASGRVLSAEQFTVATDAASAGRCVVTAAARARAGDALTVVVRAVDAAGQAAPTDLSGTTLRSNDPQATLPSAGLTQPGLAVFDGVVLRQSGAVVLTTGEGGGSTTVQVTAAAMVRLELTRVDGLPVALWGTAGSGVPLPAGQSVTMLLAARDAYGNLADNLAGPVQLTSSDARAVLPAPVQFTAGEARVHAATVVLATAGPQSIGAVAVNGMRATLPDVQVVAGPASRLQLAVPPGAVVGQALSGLSLAATDTFGNPAAGYVGATALSSDDAGASLPAAPSLVAGAPGPLPLGPATFSRPGPVRLRAETVPTGALSPVVMSFSVAPAAVDPSHVTLSGGGGSIPADGVSQAQLTLRVADASDYPVAGYAVQLSVDNGATLLPQPAAGSTSVATDAAGEVAITLSSAHAGSAHLTVTVGPALVRLATVSFVAGPSSATNSVLSVSPGTQVADGVQAIALMLTAADAQGNPVPGAAVRLRSSSGGDALTPSSGVTDATGSLQATLQGIYAGPRLLTATLSGTTVAQAVTLVPGPVAAANTALTVSPQELAADGQQASTLTLMAADAQGNAVTGQPVTVGVSGSSNVLGAAQGQTDVHGLFVTTLASTVREVKHVSALIGAVTANATVTFTSGPAAIAHSTLSASPTALPADGTSTSTLTLTAHDAQGLPAAGQAVTVLPSAPGITVLPHSGVTDGLGQFTAAASSTRATTATLVLAVGDGQLATTVQWQAGAPVASASELTLSPPLQVADGSAVALATVRLGDRFGNAVPNVAVPVSSSGTGNVVQPLASTTDASGRLQAQVQSTVAEAKVVTAQVPAVGSAPRFTLRAGARFVAGLAAASHTAVTAVPGSATADGVATVALTLRAADAQDNAVLAAPVTWSVSGTGATLTPGAPVTDATGQASASLTATTVGSRTVTAQVPGATATVAVSFSAGNANGSTSTLVASPSSVIADNVATALLTVTALDASAQPLANVAVGLSASGTGNTFAAANGFTDADGHFVTTLRASHAEAKTVTANIGGATQTATVTFVPGTPAAASSQLTVSPSSATADGSAAVGVQLQAADAQGNPTPGVAVSLAASGSGTAFTPASGVTATDGTFGSALTSTAAETKVVTATFAGQQLVASAQFLAGPPVAAHSQLTLTGSPAAADGSASLGLAVHLGDLQGNAVVSTAVTLASSGTGNAVTMIYPPAGTTDLAGNLQAALRSTMAEPKVITATAAGLTLTANGAFAAGTAAASQSTLAATPISVTADGSSTSTLTLSVRDAQGNAAANVPVALTASGGGTTLSPASGTTAADGTLTATLAASTAGSKVVTASFAGTSVSASVNFTAGVPAVTTSTLTAIPTTVVADGSARTLLTLTLRDPNGNPVPAQAVTLMASGSGNALSPAGGSTAADGTLVTTLASTVAEAKTVTATFGGSSKAATATFVAGPAASATSALSVSPASVAADGTASATLTATVRDTQGNPVSGQAVSFGTSGSGNTLSSSTATTSASGQAAVTLTSTHAEAKTVTASFASMSVTNTVNFVPTAVAAGTSTFTASPNTLVADGAASSTLVVRAFDAHGNPVPAQAVTLSSTGSGNTLNPNAGTTDASGTFTAALRSTVAEAKSLTATLSGATLDANATFVAGTAVASTSTLSLVPTSVVADGTSTATASVILRDLAGNPVAGQAVSFASSGGTVAFTPSSGASAADGSLSATLASTQAQLATVTASFAGNGLTGQVSFTAPAQVPGTPTVTSSPSTVVANGSNIATLSATVLDASSNPVVGATVSFSVSGAGNALSAPSATTNISGVASVTLTSTQAGAKTVTATTSGNTGTTPVNFVAGPMAAATSTLTASPGTVVADGSTAATLTLQARDAQGNAVTGQPATLASTGTGNTLSAASGTTDGTGALAVTLKSTVAQAKTASATVAGVTVTAPVTFTAGAPLAATSSVTVTPGSVSANGSSTATLSVLVADAQGNPVPSVAVTLTSTGTGNTLTPPSGTTAASGNVTATLASTVAEAKSVTATFGGVSVTAPVTFTPSTPVSSTSTLTASATTLTADGSTTTTLTATLRDAQGNTVPGQAVSFACSGTNNTLSATTGTTSASGQAMVTLSSTHAESKTVSLGFAGTAITAPVTFTPGAVTAGTSSLTASPNTLSADGMAASTVTATANDAQGNPIAGQAVTLTATGTGNTLNPNTGSTNSAGTFTTTLKSTLAQLKVLTATMGGVTLNANATFTASAASSSTSSLTSSIATVTANGTSTTTLTATIKDAQGNPVPGVTVTLASTGTGNTLTPASGTTNASGVVTATLASTVAEAKTVTAGFNGNSATTAVSFVPGAAAVATSSVTVSPASVTANGTSPATLTATLKDAQGNPVPITSVTLSSSGSNNAFAAATGTTNAAGIYTTTLTSTTAESKTITATFGGSSVTSTAAFVAGSPASATSSVTASPTSVLANNVATTTLTALIKDAQGNAVAGQTVTFSATGTGNSFGSTTATTNASGQAAVTLAASNAGTKTVTAAFASTSVSTTVSFTAGTVTAPGSSFTISPNSLVADNTTTAALSVYAGDAQGNPVAGQAVSLTSTGTGHTLTPSSGTTSSAGLFTATATSTVAQLKVLTATMGAVTLNANATFTAGPAASSTSTLTPSPASVVANGTATTTLTLQVNDAQGNGVSGQAVTFASSGSGNTLSATTATTSASGVASFTLKSTVAESKTVTASFNGTSVSTAVSFIAGTPVAGTSSVAASPSSVVADGVSTGSLTATLRDAQGNPVGGQTVTFTSTGTGNTFSSSTGVTSAAGTATVTLASTVAASKTITASFASTSVNTTLTFVPGAATVANSTLVSSVPSPTANGSATTTLTVTLRDAQNNAVPNTAVALSATGSANVLSTTAGNTSGAGQLSATLASTVAESKTVKASFGGLNITVAVPFVAGPMVVANSTLTASPTSPVADGSSTTTLTLTARDAYNNALATQTVSFAASGSGNTLATTSGTTSAAGAVSFTLASTVAESKTATLTVGGIAKTLAVTFVAGAPTVAQSSFSATPTSVPADNTTAITLAVSLKDAMNNPVSGTAVVFGGLPSNSRVMYSPTTTNASGAATASLTSYSAGPATLTANAGGITLSVGVTFTATGSSCVGTMFLGGPPMLQAAPASAQAVAGDLNGDGNTDVIVPTNQTSAVLVFLGHGNGVFSSPVTYTHSSINYPNSVVIADMNRDGSPDLVVVNSGGGRAITIFPGLGNGAFGSPAYFNGAPGSAVRCRVADFNGDGYLDVVASGSGSTLSLWSGNASGGLGTAVSLSPSGTSPNLIDVASVDYDLDGKVDLIVNDIAGLKMWYGLGHGDGTFGPWGSLVYTTAASQQPGLAIGDLNADGWPDVAITDSSVAQTALFINNESGGFTGPTKYTLPTTMASAAFGDVTGTGMLT